MNIYLHNEKLHANEDRGNGLRITTGFGLVHPLLLVVMAVSLAACGLSEDNELDYFRGDDILDTFILEPSEAQLDNLGTTYRKKTSRGDAGEPGYIDFADNDGTNAFVRWNVSAPPATYNVKIRYALGRTDPRPARIFIDDSRVAEVPFEGTGSFESWIDEAFTINARQGFDSFRIQPTTGRSGPDIDFVVLERLSDGGNPPAGGTPSLPGLRYSKLAREHNGSFQTKGADYLLIVKSHGRDWSKKADQGWFRASGFDVNLGVVGSHDKGMMLVRTRNTASVRIDVNDSAVQILHITTNKGFRVLNKGSGVVDPGNKAEKVQGLGSGISFYAEDEGGKGSRNEDFGRISEDVFGTGDDLLYVITGTKKSNHNGNGAIMHTSLD